MDRSSIRIVLAYLSIGILWILFSDWLVVQLISNDEHLTIFQSCKGTLYIFLTAGMLWFILTRENKLRQSNEERFTHIFAHSPVPIWVFDLETLRFLVVNDAAVTNYGYSRAEFMAMTIREIRPEEDIPLLQLQIASDPSRTSYSGEWRHRRKNGEIFTVEIRSHDMFYGSRRSRLVVAVDISARQEIEDTRRANMILSAALENEKQAYQTRSRLTSMISHDFRTPISVITASVSMLQNYDERITAEQRQRHYSVISENAYNLNQQLDELLDFLRLDVSSNRFNPVSYDITALVQETVDRFRKSHPQHELQWNTSESIIIHCDPNLIRRVLDNLISNAVKYSLEKARVTISLAANEVLTLTVSDQGIGIPKSEMVHLFEPYFRASNTEGLSGFGLGLYIVKQAVELHGGQVQVDSEPGRGTSVRIQLPLQLPDQDAGVISQS